MKSKFPLWWFPLFAVGLGLGIFLLTTGQQTVQRVPTAATSAKNPPSLPPSAAPSPAPAGDADPTDAPPPARAVLAPTVPPTPIFERAVIASG